MKLFCLEMLKYYPFILKLQQRTQLREPKGDNIYGKFSLDLRLLGIFASITYKSIYLVSKSS